MAKDKNIDLDTATPEELKVALLAVQEEKKLADEKVKVLEAEKKELDAQVVGLNQKLVKAEKNQKEGLLPEIVFKKKTYQALKPGINIPGKGLGKVTATQLAENEDLRNKFMPEILKVEPQKFLKEVE